MDREKIDTLQDLRPPVEHRRPWEHRLARLSTRTQWLLIGLLALLLLGAYWAWWTYGPDERVYSTRTWNYNKRGIAEVQINGMSAGNSIESVKVV